jgi:glycerol-3-phosphate acyltransferase PlsY
MMLVQVIFVVIVGYLLGSIPVGYVMGRLYGVDVTKYGSGRTGGTNLARLVGWPKTIPVALGDPAKAILAVLIAHYVTQNQWAAVLAALACFAGHNWSIFLGLKGGRGVGPVVGSLLVFDPLLAVVSIVVGVSVAVASRYVSLGSIIGSATAIVLSGVAYAAGRESVPHLFFAVVACGLIIAQHKDNISRLRAGTERKLGERVPITTETPASAGAKQP